MVTAASYHKIIHYLCTNLNVKIKRAKRQTLRGTSTKIRLNQHYIKYHYMLIMEKVLKEPFVI